MRRQKLFQDFQSWTVFRLHSDRSWRNVHPGAMLLLLAKESGNKTAEGVVLVVSLVVATIAIDL